VSVLSSRSAVSFSLQSILKKIRPLRPPNFCACAQRY
jgi:hypothetical protein